MWLVEAEFQTLKLEPHQEIPREDQGVLGLPTYHGQQEINNSHQSKGKRLNCPVNHHLQCPILGEVSFRFYFSTYLASYQFISAKYFPRSLASFSLVPNPNISHPLASNIMIVNKDGDLELYAIYDTPKQPIWSSRGDLAIGAGVGLKIIGDYQNTTLVDAFSSESVGQTRPASKYNKDKASSSRSIPTREHSRGRSGHRSGHPVPPNIGVDDLSLPVAYTGLSATRPAKTGTGRSVSVQKHRRSLSRTDTIPAEESISPRRTTKSREMKKHGLIRVLQDDISMVMKQRTLDGYGLSKV